MVETWLRAFDRNNFTLAVRGVKLPAALGAVTPDQAEAR
jgi:hypothetical protein